MIFHENCLLADNYHEISYLNFSKIRKDVLKYLSKRDNCKTRKTQSTAEQNKDLTLNSTNNGSNNEQ